MRKIVPESLDESLQEGVFSDIAQKIKTIFKKVGKYFTSLYNGKALEVVHPVNIGIFQTEGSIPSKIRFIPSSETVKLEPALATLKQKNLSSYKTETNPEVSIRDAAKWVREIINEMQVEEYDKAITINEAKGDAVKPSDVFAHDDPEIPDVNNQELMRRIRMVIDNQQHEGEKATPLLIWGTVGIAKTEIGTSVLQTLGKLDAQIIVAPLAVMAREDWSIPKEKDERAVQCYVDWLPLYKKTGNPELDARANDDANRGGGGILFFDEISRSSKGLIASLLTLVQSRRLGEWHLGSKWCIIAASNRQSDDPGAAYEFSSALGNRFDHVNFVPSHESWRNWAMGLPDKPKDKVQLGRWKRMLGNYKVDPRILEFTEFQRDFWHTLKKGQMDQLLFASPRTWTNASYAMDHAIKDEEKYGEGISYAEMENIIAASVGKTAAKQFMTFMTILQRYRPEDIKKILTNPKTAPLPEKKGSSFDNAEANALIFMICSYTKEHPITPKEWENYNEYLARLDNGSLATRGHKLMIEVNKTTVERGTEFYINDQLGDIPGKDKYLKGYEIFKAKYGDLF